MPTNSVSPRSSDLLSHPQFLAFHVRKDLRANWMWLSVSKAVWAEWILLSSVITYDVLLAIMREVVPRTKAILD